MRYGLVRRFVTKLVHDILPGALASLIGGFLLAHYGLGRPPEPAPVQTAPASVAMMGVLADEHSLVADFVKAETAAEKKQALVASDDAAADDAVAAAEPNRVTIEPRSIAAARPPAAAISDVKTTGPHGKAPVVAASLLPPPVIAQAQPGEVAAPVERRDGVLFTEVIKERVVAATQRAVAVIGGIPSWFGALGDRIGGENNAPRPPADLVSAS